MGRRGPWGTDREGEGGRRLPLVCPHPSDLHCPTESPEYVPVPSDDWRPEPLLPPVGHCTVVLNTDSGPGPDTGRRGVDGHNSGGHLSSPPVDLQGPPLPVPKFERRREVGLPSTEPCSTGRLFHRKTRQRGFTLTRHRWLWGSG